jgi:MFS family permease
MARWYEGAEQALFKQTAGGYVFQCPNPWLIGRSRNYVVNEAQKAEIAEHLRRQRGQTLLMAGSFAILAGVLGATLAWSFAAGGISIVSIVVIGLAAVLAIVAVVAVPQVKLMRSLRPILATAPRTDERIRFHEQIENVAKAISNTLLIVGGGGGALMIVGNLIVLLDALQQGRFARNPAWTLSSLAVGVLLTSYFVYLALLKRRLNRNAGSP